MEKRNWTKDEFILVMNLYTKIPYGQFYANNFEVKKLASLINRTPGAVAYKLVHFSGLDPYHKNRGIKGLANPGTNAINIYNEFMENWDDMLYYSELLLSQYQNKSIQEIALDKSEYLALQNEIILDKKGIDRERIVKSRVNQSLFRKVIIGNYYNACAVCKLDIPSLIVASHILKWSENEKHRLNPQNGICLCNTHDRAFELGYIGILPNYTISISDELNDMKEKDTFISVFQRHEGKQLNMPDKYYPSHDFLAEHYTSTFKK